MHSYDAERRFYRLLAQWSADTMMVSNLVSILTHPAHYGIIGMGPQALPYIFRELEKGGGPWFVALGAITQENPVPASHESSSRLIREDWIEWGRKHGYVGS